jgi:hypothetical protein
VHASALIGYCPKIFAKCKNPALNSEFSTAKTKMAHIMLLLAPIGPECRSILPLETRMLVMEKSFVTIPK